MPPAPEWSAVRTRTRVGTVAVLVVGAAVVAWAQDAGEAAVVPDPERAQAAAAALSTELRVRVWRR